MINILRYLFHEFKNAECRGTGVIETRILVVDDGSGRLRGATILCAQFLSKQLVHIILPRVPPM